MSSHPLARYEETIEGFRTHTVDQLAELPDKVEVVIGGILAGVKFRSYNSRKGPGRMAKFSVEDLTGSSPAMMWSEDLIKKPGSPSRRPDLLRPRSAQPTARAG